MVQDLGRWTSKVTFPRCNCNFVVVKNAARVINFKVSYALTTSTSGSGYL